MREPKSLRARAMDILSRREVSRLELQRKLAPYAEDEDELNQVLAEFAERNWQSDERFTEAFVNSKSRKHGALRLKQALAAKGIDSEMAREFLPDSETELANAKEVLRKKFKQPAADFAEKQKQMRFLLYRGFGMDTVQAAIRRAWAEDDGFE
ncbi:recombination regulator RecX [Kingella negevensis]|uniref:recombination regulator RecX n=1 Tax=Kingella negevensis TaxID=1522312 RepID=UPI00050A224D|nr:recombination regulator RecX [Kingella negevensis]MDK4688576.1 recombination regulator RecX [Kingella negevensis]WII91680.1 recombination regulator RecX [Kingella negevensis]